MARRVKWDVFISHASEDKEAFVKPLAQLLSDLEVKVWYDEFTLKLGDSLSRSIDKGLANSRFGVVVISRAFVKKRWPEYELRGLVTLAMAGKRKRIIPIWHDISRKEVMSFSPPLADVVAADTSKHSIIEIGGAIIEVACPDIAENINRIVAYHEMIKGAEKKIIPLSKLVPGPIQHATLPASLLIRIQNIHHIINEVFPYPLSERINDFRQDRYPDREVAIWEKIASAYLKLTTDRVLDLGQKKEIFTALLVASSRKLNEQDFSEYHYVTLQMIEDAWKNVVPNINDNEKE